LGGHGQQRDLLRPHDLVDTLKALQEPAVYLLFGAASVTKVQHVDVLVALSNAVDTADALLDLHGVPSKIEIYEQVGGLEVQALCRGVGADKDIELPLQKESFHLLALDRAHRPQLRVVVFSALSGVDPEA